MIERRRASLRHSRRRRHPRESRGNTTSVVTGLFDAAILLPARARDWDADRRRSVLLHELAHVRAATAAVQALAQAACALYWFNPLMWVTLALFAPSASARATTGPASGATPSVYAATSARDCTRPADAVWRRPPRSQWRVRREIEGRLLAVLAAGPRSRAGTLGTRDGSSHGVDCRFDDAVTPGRAGIGSGPCSRAAVDGGRRPSLLLRRLRTLSLPARCASAPIEATRRPIDPLRPHSTIRVRPVREKAALGLALEPAPTSIPPLLRGARRSGFTGAREGRTRPGDAPKTSARRTRLIAALRRSAISQVREKVAMALGTSGDARATAALESDADRSGSQVREKAVGRIDDAASVATPARTPTRRRSATACAAWSAHSLELTQ